MDVQPTEEPPACDLVTGSRAWGRTGFPSSRQQGASRAPHTAAVDRIIAAEHALRLLANQRPGEVRRVANDLGSEAGSLRNLVNRVPYGVHAAMMP